MLTSIEELLSAAPAELVVPDARAQIREHLRATGRRIAVLDDDPTGSQSLHGVQVITVLDDAAYADALREAGATCFILTNSRSLGEAEARRRTREVAADLYAQEAGHDGPTEIISRSDSCLRGHVVAEIDELATVSAQVAGRGVDGILFVPALLTAGRFTLGDVHWAVIDGKPVPVAETEFARDATFGYRHSALPEFLAEKSAGTVPAASVLSLTLDDIRVGGPERVAAVLGQADGRRWIVVNALSEHDLDVVVLGLGLAQRQGRVFLYRTGPSFVRALAGLDPRRPLDVAEVGCRADGSGHGLVVVGSHTRATTVQLDLVRRRFGPQELELDVALLLDPVRRAAHIATTAGRVTTALAGQDVLLRTSRDLVAGEDAAASLEIARQVSSGLADTVAACRAARPSWVLAKGGITSHDVAARGLGITRAEVVGQFAVGGVSLFRPVAAPDAVLGMPYVVFPGNVGGPASLADTVAVLRAAAQSYPDQPDPSDEEAGS